MDRFLIVLIVAFLVGGGYSYLLGRFFRNKIILFLPTIISFILAIYTFLNYEKIMWVAFYDLAVFLSGIIIFLVVLGNVIFNLIFNSRKKQRKKDRRDMRDKRNRDNNRDDRNDINYDE